MGVPTVARRIRSALAANRDIVTFCLGFAVLLTALSLSFYLRRDLFAAYYLRPMVNASAFFLGVMGQDNQVDTVGIPRGYCDLILNSIAYRVKHECTGLFANSVFLAAVLLAGCSVDLIGTSGANETGTIEVRIPRIAPLLAEKANRDVSAQAFLAADEIELILKDSSGATVDSLFIDNTSSGPVTYYDYDTGVTTTSWEVPAGTDYTIESNVYNILSENYSSSAASVQGVFGPFDIVAGLVTDVVILNTPVNPTGADKVTYCVESNTVSESVFEKCSPARKRSVSPFIKAENANATSS